MSFATFKKSREILRGIRVVLLGFIGLFSAAQTYAFEIPEKPTAYVNDYAQMLSVSSRDSLEKKLYAFEKSTSNQVVVATFLSLDGQSLEDVSIRLADQWKIGQKDKDNGVLLLIFKNDRQVRIEVGYGLEGALPDATCHQIIQSILIANFKKGNFDQGVSEAIDAIMAATKGEYVADPDKAENALPGLTQELLYFALMGYLIFPILAYGIVAVVCVMVFGFPVGLFIAAGVVLVMIVVRKFLFSNFIANTLGDHQSGRGGGFGGGFGSGGFGGGGGFGGFGGGGGGGFGGGGSSGRW